ncbi:MAG: hypothetical protein V4691_02355 [Pseudomonadota bacterium]
MAQTARKIDETHLTPEDKKLHRDDKNKAKKLDKQLEASFPASDPPSVTQPGGGITGPEDV